MRHPRFFSRIDFRVIPIVFCLMGISLLVISSMTSSVNENFQEVYFSSFVKGQIQWFLLGWVVFFLFAGIDYHKYAEWAWILYVIMILLLLGLYITKPIQSVHRWYRLPLIGINIQPSEYAKLIVVICLGWFLDRKGKSVQFASVSLQGLVIVGIPFLLILKQPDLGTALVLYPITLVMSYFGGVNKRILQAMIGVGAVGLVFVVLMFTGILSHEKMRPFFTTFLKEYQYERLNPNTYHQKAAQIAVGIGGLKGSGWHKGEFSSRKWLPAAHTDSVFAAFSEEFGFIGIFFLLFLFYALIYFSFQVVATAKDYFGRLLSSGIAVYLAMHIIVNIAMICGILPISGVPLVLITYGGSSVLTTMAALGILQSIYSRRFMF